MRWFTWLQFVPSPRPWPLFSPQLLAQQHLLLLLLRPHCPPLPAPARRDFPERQDNQQKTEPGRKGCWRQTHFPQRLSVPESFHPLWIVVCPSVWLSARAPFRGVLLSEEFEFTPQNETVVCLLLSYALTLWVKYFNSRCHIPWIRDTDTFSSCRSLSHFAILLFVCFLQSLSESRGNSYDFFPPVVWTAVFANFFADGIRFAALRHWV